MAQHWGFWCSGKGSCGRWNYPQNDRCFACAKIPAHAPLASASPRPPAGAWRGGGWRIWGGSYGSKRAKRTATADTQLDASQQTQPPLQQPAATTDGSASASPIAALQRSIASLEEAGITDEAILEGMQARLATLKKEKHESKRFWQRARDSESLLARKQKALTKASEEAAQAKNTIKELNFKLCGLNIDMDKLKGEILLLEKEATAPPEVHVALRWPELAHLPEETMQSEEGKKLVDSIGDSIAALLKLAPPEPAELMEVDSCSRAAEAREEARILEETFGGPTEAIPSEMFKKAAGALASARQARKASACPYPPAGQESLAPAQAPAVPAARAAEPPAPPVAPAKASSTAASG